MICELSADLLGRLDVLVYWATRFHRSRSRVFFHPSGRLVTYCAIRYHLERSSVSLYRSSGHRKVLGEQIWEIPVVIGVLK